MVDKKKQKSTHHGGHTNMGKDRGSSKPFEKSPNFGRGRGSSVPSGSSPCLGNSLVGRVGNRYHIFPRTTTSPSQLEVVRQVGGGFNSAPHNNTEEKQNGKSPTVAEVYKTYHKCKNDNTWVSPHASQLMDNYQQLASTEHVRDSPPSQESATSIWTRAVGGKDKKGRIAGMKRCSQSPYIGTEVGPSNNSCLNNGLVMKLIEEVATLKEQFASQQTLLQSIHEMMTLLTQTLMAG